MNRIRKNWKNKPERKYCIVTTQNGRYLLYIKTRGEKDFKHKEYKTAAGALNYLQKNGFSPHPPPSLPKEIYLQKVRAKSLELGRVWLRSILHLLNTATVSKALGITEKQFHYWLEGHQLKSDIDYTKFRQLRKLITRL